MMGWSLDLMCVLVYVWEVAEMEEGCGGGTDMYVPRGVGRMAVASHTTAGSLDGTVVLWFRLEWKRNQAGEKKRHGALVPAKSRGGAPCASGEGWLPSAFPSFLPSMGAPGWPVAGYRSAAALPRHVWAAGISLPPPGATWKCFLKGSRKMKALLANPV